MAWVPIVSPYSFSEPLEFGTPTCLVPKHLQISKVEHPKHNAFQRFRRDLRNTSGRLKFIYLGTHAISLKKVGPIKCQIIGTVVSRLGHLPTGVVKGKSLIKFFEIKNIL